MLLKSNTSVTSQLMTIETSVISLVSCKVVTYGGAYSDLVITVRVLRLFHNNRSGSSDRC